MFTLISYDIMHKSVKLLLHLAKQYNISVKDCLLCLEASFSRCGILNFNLGEVKVIADGRRPASPYS